MGDFFSVPLSLLAKDLLKPAEYISMSIPKSAVGFFTGIFTLILLVLVVRMLFRMVFVNRIIPFWSRRSIMTTRLTFTALLAILTCVFAFFSSQVSASFGPGERNIVKNSFRFAGEYNRVVRTLATGLTEEQKALVASLPGKYRSAEAFVSANARTEVVTRGKGRKAKTVTTMKLTPAGAAVVTAVSRTYKLLIAVSNILFLFFILTTTKLLFLGRRAWLAYTAGKRNIMKLLNLLYYLGYIPLVFYYGFVHPFGDLPSTSGSPGKFSRTQAYVRGCLAASLMLLAIFAVYTGGMAVDATSPQIGWAQLAALGVALTLVVTGMVAAVWSRKAAKGYRAEKNIAGEVINACLFSKPVRQGLSDGMRVTVYWGKKYPYRRHIQETTDLASRVAGFAKAMLGKANTATADIDLSISCVMSDGAVAWLVCEIKSYYAGKNPSAWTQVIRNAEIAGTGENTFLVDTAVISQLRSDQGIAWLRMAPYEKQEQMSVKDLVEKFVQRVKYQHAELLDNATITAPLQLRP